MSTKSFFWLVAGTLVVGVGIGAAISVVVALGDGAAVGTGQTNIPAQSTSGAIPQSPDRVGPPSPDQLQEENQSGETSPAELGQRGQQPQGQAGQGGLESGAIEGDSLTGTIEKIEGDTVTLNTPQGLLQAITAADTTIQMFSQGTATDLDAGVRVTVIGQRGEDGTVEARSISVIPEGAEGLFGLGFAGRLGQNTDGQDLLAQFRERVQSGEITQEELEGLRQQGQRRFGQGATGGQRQFGQQGPGGQAFGGDGQSVPGGRGLEGDLSGRFSLTGTIENIEGTTMTVNTPQGPLEAELDNETIIQVFSEGIVEDLQAGMRVTVTG